MHLDKKTELYLINLERKFGDIIYVPLDTIEDLGKVIDDSNILLDHLPFIEITSMNKTTEIISDFDYNAPLTCVIILENNTTISVSKKNDSTPINITIQTKCFMFNTGLFTCNSDKPVLIINGILKTEIETILENNINKYNIERVYNNKKQYTVYNVTTKLTPFHNPHNAEDVIRLYTLLLTSPEVVAVEEHQSNDGLRSEFRVIFWNQESYYHFSERVKGEYQNLIEKLNSNYISQPVTFSRYTSEENYQSEFPEKYYPNKTPLIDWVLIPYFKQWFIDNIMPLGKVQDYIGNGDFSDPNISGCRYLKERTNNVVRLDPSKKSKDNFPSLLAYTFDHVLQFAISKQPYVYHKFFKICKSFIGSEEPSSI